MRNKKLITALLIAVPIVAFAAIYFLFFTPDAPPPVELDDPPRTASSGDVGDPVGLWTVASGSEAGYRVREKLARLPAQSDAVGKTDAVVGSMAIERQSEGFVATGIQIEVDTTKLRSDEARRDRAIRERGLQTDSFPIASFVSAGPVTIPADAEDGSRVSLDLPGDLTIHGVTKTVSIPIEARFSEGLLEVAGSYKFPMSDFEVEPPSVADIVTVEPEGTMEFKLLLTNTEA